MNTLTPWLSLGALGALLATAACGDDDVNAAADTLPTVDVPDVGLPDAGAGPTVELLSVELDHPRPADLLFLRLEGDGLGAQVHVEGIRRGAALLLDRDAPEADTFPFALTMYDADGATLYRRTLREPIQIREFLALAPLPEGFEPFALFPELGDFAVKVPRLDGAVRVAFERREEDGSSTALGEVELASIAEMPTSALEGSPVVRIAGPDDPAGALDVVILADGYTAAELDQFAADADGVVAEFLRQEPYPSFADRITFHRIDTPSAESGAGFDCSHLEEIPGCRDELKDVAFSSVYPLRAAVMVGMQVADRNVIQLDQWEVSQVASAVPFDAIIVIVNTPKYGAFGLWHASLSSGVPFAGELAVHEFTHAFALLGDEYYFADDTCQHYALTPDYPNLSLLVSTPEELKWAPWLTPGVPLPTPGNDPAWEHAVGLFKGGGGSCTDMYRPTKDCLMRSWGTPLCAVCGDGIVRSIYRHVDLLGAAGVAVTADGALRADVPDGALVTGTWRLDGADAGPADQPLVLPPADGDAREHEVELTIRDATPRVLIDTAVLEERVRATVRVTP